MFWTLTSDIQHDSLLDDCLDIYFNKRGLLNNAVFQFNCIDGTCVNNILPY